MASFVRVRELLKEGYGVEDIAVMLNVDVDLVRNAVAQWRNYGSIKLILGK